MELTLDETIAVVGIISVILFAITAYIGLHAMRARKVEITLFGETFKVTVAQQCELGTIEGKRISADMLGRTLRVKVRRYDEDGDEETVQCSIEPNGDIYEHEVSNVSYFWNKDEPKCVRDYYG